MGFLSSISLVKSSKEIMFLFRSWNLKDSWLTASDWMSFIKASKGSISSSVLGFCGIEGAGIIGYLEKMLGFLTVGFWLS